jgi:hypothetical protein
MMQDYADILENVQLNAGKNVIQRNFGKVGNDA